MEGVSSAQMEQQKTEQYKKEIAEMVEEIEIPGFISMIYGFVKGLYEEEKKRKGDYQNGQ